MEPYTQHTEAHESEQDRGGRIATGIVLIALGAIFLIGQLFDLGVAVLPILGMGFTFWGLFARHYGPLIPGGILNGIGLGVFLINGPYTLAGPEAEGGLFLLGFALGWVSIYVLSKLFTAKPQTWALIPGGIMASIGTLALAQETQLLQLLGIAWPVALIIGGLYLILRYRESRPQSE